jgi:hypothetical protein
MRIAKYFSRHIGIIGAGIAGLHLGLRLRQLDIPCTIMTDRTPDQVAAGRLANTVPHWSATLQRERVLRVGHWPGEQFGFNMFRNVIQTPQPIDIRGYAAAPARAVDYRMYLPRLMQDFVARGGHLEMSSLDAKDIGRVAARFGLVVIATPGHGFSSLFARDDANSPYDRPQRTVMAGLFTGVRPMQARAVTVSVMPGHSEAIEVPLLSRTGLVTALVFSAWEADALAMLRVLSGRADRAGFRAALLDLLERHHPTIYHRIDTARFDLQGPDDLVHVAITPIVRHPIAHLGGDKFAIALGDAHVTVDPLLGQGDNIGSYSAFVLADAIQEASAFDLAFCHEVERARSARVLGASRLTNAFLQPPDEARLELLVAMSNDPHLANEYFDNFNRPERQWERVGSPERIRAWLREQRVQLKQSLAVVTG